MKSIAKAVLTALIFILAVYAENSTISTVCPLRDVCYRLNIPKSTATWGQGDIYFQIRASTAYEWVALGQGSQMTDSNIFVLYPSADGHNVTVSPRLGKGHFQPHHDATAQITLLEGSRVTYGWMTANVKCSNCDRWAGGSMNFKSSNEDWIYAVKQGSPLHSDDLNERITQHDSAETFSWPISNAKGGDNNVNPFTTSTTVGQHSSPIQVHGNGYVSWKLIWAHGGLAALAFVVLFPFGGIAIRLANFRGGFWIHVGLQTISWFAFLIAFGLGIHISVQMDMIKNAHPIIGIALGILLLGQPLYGYLHHKRFRESGRRMGWSYTHIAIGRIAILLGMINGALGIRLAGNVSTKGIIGYAVVAVFIALLYIAAIIYGERKLRKSKEAPKKNANGTGDRELLLMRNLDPNTGEARAPRQGNRSRAHSASRTEYTSLSGLESYGYKQEKEDAR